MSTNIDLLGTTLSINPRGTTESVGFNADIAVVGGYNATNASSDVSPNEAYAVNGGVAAGELFGTESELSRVTAAAAANPVNTIYGVPLDETTTTETFDSTSSGTLDDAPVFDPSVNPEHDVTAQDTSESVSMTVEYVRGETPSAPSDANTIVLNPSTGEWAADASSNYEVTYTHGDFASALEVAAQLDVRYVVPLTANDSVKATAVSEVSDEARNGVFSRVVANATPNIDSADIAQYTPTETDYRLVEVAPARMQGPNGEVRGCGVVAGLLAGQPINADGSITYDDLAGVTDVNTQYRPTEAEGFEQVTAVDRSFTVVGGKTTSDEAAFSDIYATEIIDLVAESLLDIAAEYKGGGNFNERAGLLQKSMERTLRGFADQRPPLLADPGSGPAYQVTVTQGSADNTVAVNTAIDPAPIMEEIELGVNVGDIVSFDGAQVA